MCGTFPLASFSRASNKRALKISASAVGKSKPPEGFCLVSLLVTFFSSWKPPSAIVRFLQNESNLGRPPCSHAQMVPPTEQLKGFKFEILVIVS